MALPAQEWRRTPEAGGAPEFGTCPAPGNDQPGRPKFVVLEETGPVGIPEPALWVTLE